MASTKLSTLLARMDRYQSESAIEEQFKVRDLDDALRTIKRSQNLPFFQKKGSLKVFCNVFEYPAASDHDYLVFLDHPQQDLSFGQHLRARYTSLQQFYENPDYRNQIAEIWNNNTLTLGVADKDGQFQGFGQQTLDTAESTSNHVASGDAYNLQISYVNFIVGAASIQFSVLNAINTATITDTFTGFTDANYQALWYFRWVYLNHLPTSITLSVGADASNYLYGTVTTQFSGQAFAENQWNLVAFDLNAPTGTTGTINTSTVFAWEQMTLTGAATGLYYMDSSYLRGWELLDYWYYSKFAVDSLGGDTADQEYFYTAAGTYDTNSSMVGVAEWADVVMYTAICNGMMDKENQLLLGEMEKKRALAWERLGMIWPDLKPQVNTNKYRFKTDYSAPSNWIYPWW